jgi:acetyl esterase/lipase
VKRSRNRDATYREESDVSDVHLGIVAVIVNILPAVERTASAAEYAVATRMKVPYVEHDGVKLTGDLYVPKGRDKAPVIIAVHGGGWQAGAPSTYQHWGSYLARNGYAVFAISYRLSEPGANRRSMT